MKTGTGSATGCVPLGERHYYLRCLSPFSSGQYSPANHTQPVVAKMRIEQACGLGGLCRRPSPPLCLQTFIATERDVVFPVDLVQLRTVRADMRPAAFLPGLRRHDH